MIQNIEIKKVGSLQNSLKDDENITNKINQYNNSTPTIILEDVQPEIGIANYFNDFYLSNDIKNNPNAVSNFLSQPVGNTNTRSISKRSLSNTRMSLNNFLPLNLTKFSNQPSVTPFPGCILCVQTDKVVITDQINLDPDGTITFLDSSSSIDDLTTMTPDKNIIFKDYFYTNVVVNNEFNGYLVSEQDGGVGIYSLQPEAGEDRKKHPYGSKCTLIKLLTEGEKLIHAKREFTYLSKGSWKGIDDWRCVRITNQLPTIEFWQKNEAQPETGTLVAENADITIDIARNYENCIKIYDYNDNYLNDIEVFMKTFNYRFQESNTYQQPATNSITSYNVTQPEQTQLSITVNDVFENTKTVYKTINIIDTPPELVILQPSILEVNKNVTGNLPTSEIDNYTATFKYWDIQDATWNVPITYFYAQPSQDYTQEFINQPSNWTQNSILERSITRLNKIVYKAWIPGQPNRSFTEKSRIINIVDTTPPTLTLQNNLVQTFDVGLSPGSLINYNELQHGSWTVDDNYSEPENILVDVEYFKVSQPEDITGQPVSELTKSITQQPQNGLGTYRVKYTASDEAGNTAESQYRTIHLLDNTAPVITVNNLNIFHEAKTIYTDTGVSAYDHYDGDITSNIIVTTQPENNVTQPDNLVDIHQIGEYKIYYNIQDSSGNNAIEQIKTVTVRDTTPPVLTLLNSVSQLYDTGASPLIDYDENINGGYTVTDTYWQPENITVDLEHFKVSQPDSVSGQPVALINKATSDQYGLGMYRIKYTATDGSGNSTVKYRNINLQDTSIPVITLIGSSSINHEVMTTYSDQGATAYDNNDGDLTSSIVTVNNVNDTTTGTYQITYNVVDSSGNNAVEVIRNVIVEDTTAPTLTLQGDASYTLNVGKQVPDTYTEPGWLVSDNYSQPENITVEVDYFKSATTTSITGQPVSEITKLMSQQPENGLGIYRIKYTASDEAGNVATSLFRTVHLEDSVKPIITRTGNAIITQEVFSAYNDQGATANDYYWGDLTGDIVVNNQVDINVVNNYTVTYNLTDNSGNVADEVTRTVRIVDTTLPTITTNTQPSTYDVGVQTPGVFNITGGFDFSVSDNYSQPENITKQTTYTFNNQPVAGIDENSLVGNYKVIYTAEDEHNNIRTQDFDVTVFDNTSPIITFTAEPETIELSLLSGGFTDQPAPVLATDFYDDRHGNNLSITNNINTLDFTTMGDKVITYTVTDSNNNSTTSNRTIKVVDTISPTITINGSNPLNVGISSVIYSPLEDPGITVSDDVSQPENIAITTKYFRTSQPSGELTNIGEINDIGTYRIEYTAVDEGQPVANQRVENRTVNVVYDYPRFPDDGVSQPEWSPDLQPESPPQTRNITIDISKTTKTRNINLNDASAVFENIVKQTQENKEEVVKEEVVEDVKKEVVKKEVVENVKEEVVEDVKKEVVEDVKKEVVKEKTKSEPKIEKKTLPKKQVSSKKYAKEEKALVIDENKYKKQDLIIQEHNLSRSTDQFERLQFGNYKAITIKNTNKYDVYMNSIDLHAFTSDKNVRVALYYVTKVPTLFKNKLSRDNWTLIRSAIRIQNYNRKITKNGGAVVTLPIKDVLIKSKRSIYLIISLDNDDGYLDLLTNGSGKYYQYRTKWETVYKKIYHKVSGYKLVEKTSSPQQTQTKKPRSMLKFGEIEKHKIKVNKTKYYYFELKSNGPCYLHIDDREIVSSKRKTKSARGSIKLEKGVVYNLTLFFAEYDDVNYFAWSNTYNRNWCDDFKDKSSIEFLN